MILAFPALPIFSSSSLIANMPDNLCVIGWGNLDREDDGAGILVARKLVELGIPALAFTGEALSLLDTWKGATHVVVVDAVTTGAPLGTVHVWDVAQADLPNSLAASTHGFGLAEAIALARSLGQLPARLRVYGIEAGKFGFGSGLSPEVAAVIEQAARQIAAECKRLTSW
jgi:hydrogenase maturation protease